MAHLRDSWPLEKNFRRRPRNGSILEIHYTNLWKGRLKVSPLQRSANLGIYVYIYILGAAPLNSYMDMLTPSKEVATFKGILPLQPPVAAPPLALQPNLVAAQMGVPGKAPAKAEKLAAPLGSTTADDGQPSKAPTTSEDRLPFKGTLHSHMFCYLDGVFNGILCIVYTQPWMEIGETHMQGRLPVLGKVCSKEPLKSRRSCFARNCKATEGNGTQHPYKTPFNITCTSSVPCFKASLFESREMLRKLATMSSKAAHGMGRLGRWAGKSRTVTSVQPLQSLQTARRCIFHRCYMETLWQNISVFGHLPQKSVRALRARVRAVTFACSPWNMTSLAR